MGNKKTITFDGSEFHTIIALAAAASVRRQPLAKALGQGLSGDEAVAAVRAASAAWKLSIERHSKSHNEVDSLKKIFIPEAIFTLPEGKEGTRLANCLRARHEAGLPLFGT